MPVLELPNHEFDVAVFGARFEHGIAAARITPFEDFDGHAAHAPLVHARFARLVEIDGIGSGQHPPVVVHFVDLTGLDEVEFGSQRPARPIRRCAVDFAAPQFGACRRLASVFAMIRLGVRVGGGPHILHGRGRERFFVGWQFARGGTSGEQGGGQRGGEEKAHASPCHTAGPGASQMRLSCAPQARPLTFRSAHECFLSRIEPPHGGGFFA